MLADHLRIGMNETYNTFNRNIILIFEYKKMTWKNKQ